MRLKPHSLFHKLKKAFSFVFLNVMSKTFVLEMLFSKKVFFASAFPLKNKLLRL